MKRTIVAMIGVLAALAIPVLAAAQPAHSEMTTKKADLTLSQPLIVGTTTVEPGEYRYHCVTINGETFLVVTSDRGNEVARVPCTPEPLAKKTELSDVRTTTRDGKTYLTAVRIKGEMVMHRIVMATGA